MLLHLISRAKVDIRDIFISEITEQYLASMESIHELDMDSASEFLQMASTLLEIKSRSLLPKPPKGEEDELDPEQELIRRLEEYKRFKEAGEQLQELEKSALSMFYRLPDELAGETRVELGGLTLEGLVAAFRRILERMQDTQEEGARVTYIRRETWTVQECMFRIQSRLKEGEAVLFDSLFEHQPTRAEIVTVFIALLELWRLGMCKVRQSSVYGDIELYKG